jgi:choline-sulfatase
LWHLLQPHEPNLFAYLRKAGYHVAAFGKNDVFSPDAVTSSLDTYVSLNAGANSGANNWPMDDPRRFSFLVDPFEGSPDETKDARHVSSACDYLRDRAATQRGADGEVQPFLLFVPLTLPHPPYGPPEPYYSRYSPGEVEVRPAREDTRPDFHRLVRRYRGLDRADETLFHKIRAVYYGMVDYVDSMLGRLAQTLDETGLSDSTYLVAASDHGDLAGDYGLVEKIHNAHYDPLTRVPLLIRSPNQDGASTVVDRPTALMDIMATILDAAEIDAEHTHFSRSLLPDLGIHATPDSEEDKWGPPAWTAADGAVFTENGFRTDEKYCFEGSVPGDGTFAPDAIYYPQTRQFQEHPESMDRVITIRTAHDKLSYRPRGVSEYFDLVGDPKELVNRYDDPQCGTRVAELESRLLSWLALTSDAVPYHHDPRGFEGEQKGAGLVR